MADGKDKLNGNKSEDHANLEYLNAQFGNLKEVGDENQEADSQPCGSNTDSQKDDKSTEPCDTRCISRVFMEGLPGDGDALLYPGQVEVVAGFVEISEQMKSPKSEEPVALLDDRKYGGISPVKRKNCRAYAGPLCSKRLREELSKQVLGFSLVAR
jgi:hypothetical protein